MKKRILAIFICIVVQISAFVPCSASELKEEQLFSKSAVLLDGDSQRVLFSKNGEEIMPMASTTKIMTCILALEKGTLTDYVTVSKHAQAMPDVQLNMTEGECYKLEDLLYSMMLESHNDSAVAVAEHIGGSVEGFAEMMNKKAVEIGCENTYFITPNGLDATKTVEDREGNSITKVHSTTANDLAKILSYCVRKSPKKDEFLKITQTGQYSLHNYNKGEEAITPGSRSISCANHNAFLGMMKGALSGKTGFTGNAGYCYAGALENEGRTYIVALLACGWPNNKSYKWSDTKKLMEYGLENFKLKEVSFDSGTIKPDIIKNGAWEYGDAARNRELHYKANFPQMSYLLSNKDEVRMITGMKENITAPVKKGQKMGDVKVYINEALVKKIPVYAKNSITLFDYNWCLDYIFEAFFPL